MNSSHQDGAVAPRHVTAADVARVAKVSQSTVSLVMNSKWQNRVSEETARRVIDTARLMRYRTNLAARNLRLGTADTVLLIVPALTNPFFAAVHAGAARVGMEQGVGLVVFPLSAEDDSGPFSAPQQAIDGVISCSVSADAVSALRAGLPLVTLDDAPSQETPSVSMDVTGGMRQAVNHLVELGHRRILHLRAARPAWTFTCRSAAFVSEGVARSDLTASQITCSFAPSDARDRVAQVLARADRPTSVICDDDNLAVGVYAAAAGLGLSIPDDLSVVGFNDIPIASLLHPQLTSVRLPAEQLGIHGMRTYLRLRQGEPVAPVSLPVHMVVRGSTGPPPVSE
ncbi:LacI family DNA-binding transcriptional regulator [Streptomyces sp. NPDC088719]|uniref:LacI family DNA-binding transcriptional regulator n=1 Tax=Streptomyces sp. NPDC088719 TaxID=3365872 RepID=UPI00380E9B17